MKTGLHSSFEPFSHNPIAADVSQLKPPGSPGIQRGLTSTATGLKGARALRRSAFRQLASLALFATTLGPAVTAAAADTTLPTLVSAVRQINVTNIIVTFSECMETNALDRFNYLVCTDETFSDCLTIFGNDPSDPDGNTLTFVEGSGQSQVLLTTGMPLDVNQPYILGATLVSDCAGNTVFDLLLVDIINAEEPSSIGVDSLANPGFESGLDSWHTFGNASPANISHNGSYSLALSGYSPGSFNASGAYQTLPASAGQRWTLSGYGMNHPDNPLLGGNYALLKIVWFDGPNGTGNMLQPLPGAGALLGDNPGIESAQLDYFTPRDVWLPLSASGVAPEGTRSVQLFGGLFLQVNQAPGAALFDDLAATATTEWGNALSFDGIDDYVVFDRPVSNDFTLECWLRSTQVAGGDGQWWQGMGLVDGEVNGLVRDFGLALGAGRVLFGTGGTNDVTIRSGAVADGRWHHVAATRERSTGVMRLYVDGWLVASGTNGTQTLDAPAEMRLGSLATGNNYFQGELDDVRIWSVVRSRAEIQDGMNRPLTGREADLVAYWNLDEGSGDTAHDATPNAHHATVTNWTAWVASSVAAENLAVNPGFEEGTTGWLGFGYAALVTTDVWPHSGGACGHVTNRQYGYAGVAQSLVGVLQPGVQYHISAWVRLDNAASGPVVLTFQKTDGDHTSYQNVASGTATSNQWIQLSGSYTLSVTGVLNGLNLYLQGPEPGTNFYVDDFVVEAVTRVGTIDATVTHQTIEGFGGSLAFYNNWLTAHPYKEEIYTNIFSGLNLGILRIGNWFRYQGTPDFDLHTRQIVSNANQILGRPVTLQMSSWSPPAFLKSNGQTGNGGTLTNIGGRFAYAEFADYWYDSLMWYQTNGIVPAYISIQNEPDYEAGWDSCKFLPNEDIVSGTNYASYALALDAVYQRLASLPTPPKIIGPEVLGLGYNVLQNYAATMNPSSFCGVAHHLYHGGDSDWVISYIPDMEGTATLFPDKPKFQTEYGHGDMIQTALLIHYSLTVEEVSVYIFWSLVWPKKGEPDPVSGPALVQQEWPWDPDWWTNAPPGTLTQARGYWLTPQYYAMKHFSYFIEPGYRRVETPGNDPAARLSAYLAPDRSRLVVVMINPESGSSAVTLNLNGFAVGASAVYQTVGLNADRSQFAPLGSAPTDLQFSLPGYSLTTVVFEPPYTVANLSQLPATGLIGDTATLNGTVNPAGQETTAWFEWGTSTAYGNRTELEIIPGGTNPVPVSALLSSLDPNLTYHYRLVASNRLGIARGPDQVFSFPIIFLSGPDPLTNECHTAFMDPGAFVVQPTIAAGFLHSLALPADGTVYGWGYNNSGQANPPESATNVVAIAGGGWHSLALRADGTVVGWGYNGAGQVTIPGGLVNVVAIAAGANHSLALEVGGIVVGWGQNNHGQTITPDSATNVVAIAAGYAHSLALRADGRVVGWGYNGSGQITIPDGLANVVAIAAGGDHSLALLGNGQVAAWGSDSLGQISVPTAAQSEVVAIAAGQYHNLALKADGTVVGWGAGTFIGSDPHYGQAVIPAEATNVVAIAGGRYHSLALRADGMALAWGAGTDNTGSGTSHGQAMIPGELMMPAGLSRSQPVISVSGTLDPRLLGTYELTYTATNALGAVGTATRTVHVVDTTPPGLTLLGASPLIHPYQAPFVDPGATATDLCDGDVTSDIIVTGTVDPNVLGIYGLTYSVSDPNGNSATANRTVHVMIVSFTPGDLDGDGVLGQAEFDAVAQNYWGLTSRPYMTNLVTDGAGLFQMTLTNAAAWNFSVEVSTNLVDWDYLGPAWPTLEFYDPEATNAPQRFYRLTWP